MGFHLPVHHVQWHSRSCACTRAVPHAVVAQRTHLRPRLQRREWLSISRAGSDGVDKANEEEEEEEEDKLKSKFFSDAPKPSEGAPNPIDLVNPVNLGRQAREVFDKSVDVDIDVVNPYAMGKQARQAFDRVWEGITRLTSPTKSFLVDDVMDTSLDSDEEVNTEDTTVLVVGATGNVGRILTRKLLLRGYKVKALVRTRGGLKSNADEVELPAAVEKVEGDVGDLKDCQFAVKGVDKVIFCAAARSTFTGDLLRVDDRGVMNIVKSLQDDFYRRSRRQGRRYSTKSKKEIADFNAVYHQLRWDVRFVGVPREDKTELGGATRQFDRSNRAEAVITEEKNLLFEGTLTARGAVAEVGAPVNPLLPHGEHRTLNSEGVTLRVRGDGHSFACILRTEEGHRYSAKFPTRTGYLHIRLPWSAFRPEQQDQPDLQPEAITYVGISYENRRPVGAGPMRGLPSSPPSGPDPGRFEIEVDWIKALPGGLEPDVVLVSCAGTPRNDMSEADLLKVVAAKRSGEESLRNSGLGYTIIRPGQLVEEPGGYRALVFDQGGRITERISYADVADICLRALREPEARNKTFDVCYEYQAQEGTQLYELVAAAASSKDVNYLKPALASLQKNT